MNRNHFLSIVFITLFSIPIIGCSNHTKETATPALFETEQEAINAAKDFECTGAHKMGNKWMPCEKHGDNEKEENNHGHHHSD